MASLQYLQPNLGPASDAQLRREIWVLRNEGAIVNPGVVLRCIGSWRWLEASIDETFAASRGFSSPLEATRAREEGLLPLGDLSRPIVVFRPNSALINPKEQPRGPGRFDYLSSDSEQLAHINYGSNELYGLSDVPRPSAWRIWRLRHAMAQIQERVAEDIDVCWIPGQADSEEGGPNHHEADSNVESARGSHFSRNCKSDRGLKQDGGRVLPVSGKEPERDSRPVSQEITQLIQNRELQIEALGPDDLEELSSDVDLDDLSSDDVDRIGDSNLPFVNLSTPQTNLFTHIPRQLRQLAAGTPFGSLQERNFSDVSAVLCDWFVCRDFLVRNRSSWPRLRLILLHALFALAMNDFASNQEGLRGRLQFIVKRCNERLKDDEGMLAYTDMTWTGEEADGYRSQIPFERMQMDNAEVGWHLHGEQHIVLPMWILPCKYKIPELVPSSPRGYTFELTATWDVIERLGSKGQRAPLVVMVMPEELLILTFQELVQTGGIGAMPFYAHGEFVARWDYDPQHAGEWATDKRVPLDDGLPRRVFEIFARLQREAVRGAAQRGLATMTWTQLFDGITKPIRKKPTRKADR
ncbi:hypothetical protein KC331_g224 [Hortaea werneckii]|nr:hypothetical protein KC331_g224 [Hortaea werneckii]KAI7722700.1 hypothetical protein KC353_g261 [Hortaea werneckii]